MKDLQQLLNEVNIILDTFKKEEVGNRLSQFSVIALKQMINEIIIRTADKEDKEKDG